MEKLEKYSADLETPSVFIPPQSMHKLNPKELIQLHKKSRQQQHSL